MKRIVALSACVVATLMFAALVLAQSNPAAPRSSGRPEGVATKKKMRGAVLGIDVGASTVTISYRKATVTFFVGEDTIVKQAGMNRSLADIRTGDKVTIHYKQEKKRKIAIAILVQGGPAATAP